MGQNLLYLSFLSCISDKLLEDRNSPGVKAVVEQIKKRFQDFETVEKIKQERLFAAGCDGDTLVFVRHRGKDFEIEDPQEVTSHNVERLLRAIVSLGARGYSFTPENLTEHFGVDGTIAQKGIHSIYKVICDTHSAKAKVFFDQWKIFFGEVCGYDVTGRNIKIDKLGEQYGISNIRPAEILFAVHTYYAVFIKLLAAEIVSSFSPLGTSMLKRLISAPTSAKLKSELGILEKGGIWSELGIRNFLEGDLFSWYIDAWDERCFEAIHEMVVTLDQYDASTLSVEPSESRDLLKKLYQHLFPKSLRHDLGEYYTPDWLAEYVLDEVDYDGDPDKRVLDPACGSGTFLVMIINRIKNWFDEHRHECGFGEEELLNKILSNVIGFDLNPLAVMASRTNYLLAIRDLLRYSSNVEIPVYLCDSLMVPSEYGDLFTQSLGNTRRLRTSVGDFLIPSEVSTNSEQIGKYADTIEFSIDNKYDTSDFLSLCRTENIAINEEQLHKDLYEKLRELDRNNENGIWARIIKNAFAPLFIERVNYVIGNPPWINFENLPVDYRPELINLFDTHYGLFIAKGLDSRHGASSIDISSLFPYVAAENYLENNGKIAFLITQTLFQSVAAAGFRKFSVLGTPLKVIRVHDMSSLMPFDKATNKTAILVLQHNEATKYPVPYKIWAWQNKRPSSVLDLTLEEALEDTEVLNKYASPVDAKDITSPWMIFEKGSQNTGLLIQGNCYYHPHKGCDTSGANAIFWVEILKVINQNTHLVRNIGDAGRKHKFESIERKVESEYIYPLLRGRDVQPWMSEPSCYILCAQRKGDFSHAVPEKQLKSIAPNLYSYFNFPAFRERLEVRAGYVKYLKPHGEPFYALYDIKNYTEFDWKVVIREQASGLVSAVVGPFDQKIVIPDHKLSLVACENAVEAHYLCALLNSAPAKYLIHGFGINTQISVSTVRNLNMKRYDSSKSLHQDLSKISKQFHKVSQIGDNNTLDKLEDQLDKLAVRYAMPPQRVPVLKLELPVF